MRLRKEIHKALEPIADWYGGGTEGNRSDIEIITDVVADLQKDRAELLLLKQQPSRELVKKIRKFVKMYENEIPRRAEISFLKEACGIIDRTEASKVDLLEACKYSHTLLLRKIGQATHAVALLEAAMAKAKKEG